jgi:hypothetical protein
VLHVLKFHVPEAAPILSCMTQAARYILKVLNYVLNSIGIYKVQVATENAELIYLLYLSDN